MFRVRLFLFLILSTCGLQAQVILQNIRGQVVDKFSQQGIPGVNVVILDSDPLRGTSTDSLGFFRLEDVAAGRVSLSFSFVGYKTQSMTNLQLNSAKELILRIELEEHYYQSAEFVVTDKADRREALNKMASVSARTFSIEESQKYAGSLNDVSRMAQNFAGVQASNDNRNDLIIRGNSSLGVLFRLEGIDIPNPNHFALLGSSGGPISILNNNTLSNSDFFTGAFPAEYGNALAGVFDLQLRNGNDEQREFTGQIGFNGAELLAEGPFQKAKRASYLLSYRYSTLDLFKAMGIQFGTQAVPKYQDATVKLNFPHKKGKTSLFMMGGISNISFLDSERGEEETFFDDGGEDLHYGTRLGIAGLSHTRILNKKSFIRLNLSVQWSAFRIDNDSLGMDGTPFNVFRNNNEEGRLSANLRYNSKLNSRNLFRAGLFADQLRFNYDVRVLDRNTQVFFFINNSKGNTYLLQPFVQWKHRFSGNLSLNLGMHAQYLTLNGKSALEPRMGLKWDIDDKSSLSFGAGRHSQVPAMNIYLRNRQDNVGNIIQPNRELKLMLSDHYVLAFDRALFSNMRFKTEVYFQYLSKVPIDRSPSTYTLLNQGAGFTFGFPDTLVNEGFGRNYGLEFTLERFLSKGLYFLYTLSLFESEYQASDGNWYNTAFNGNFVSNFLIGKEWQLNRPEAKAAHILAVNFRGTTSGGQRYVPIDLEQSRLLAETVLDFSGAYEKRYPSYLRFDVRLSWKRNGQKFAQEWAVDLQNIFDRNNVYYQEYSVSQEDLVTRYQLGFLPVVLYRVYF